MLTPSEPFDRPVPSTKLVGSAVSTVSAFFNRLKARHSHAPSYRWVDSNNLAIRKLEPRLVFNASIQTLAVPSIAVEGDTVTASAIGDNGVILGSGLQFDWSLVQDNTVIETSTDSNFTFTPVEDGQYEVRLTVSEQSGDDSASATINVTNAKPRLSDIRATNLLEGGETVLTGKITDPGIEDDFELTVTWGDGLQETFFYAAGTTEFKETHRYLDDDPSGTLADPYLIELRLRDDDGGQSFDETEVVVRNVAPSNIRITPLESINEGDAARFRVTFDDPGIDDTHVLNINWGDGTQSGPIALTGGEREVIVTHRYVDDDPTGTSSDRKLIRATLTDDDGGRSTGFAFVRVNNVAPSDIRIMPLERINEGDLVDFRVTFDDPGKNDTHTVIIDWGDGTVSDPIVVPAGSREVITSHRYLDDNPAGTPFDFKRVKVTVIDDDNENGGGTGVGLGFVQVNNIAPTLLELEATDVNGQGESFVAIKFSDPGESSLNDFSVVVKSVAGSATVTTVYSTNPSMGQGMLTGPAPVALGTNGTGPYEYTATLVFNPAPDPINPADDITIFVTVVDHDTGVSNELQVDVSSSGTEDNAVAIDTTPQIDLIEFPVREDVLLPVVTISDSTAILTNTEQRSASSDISATADRYFELRVVLPDDSYGESYRLPSDAIDDLPALFRTLPDNHYRIFLVRTENNSERLVIDVFVRNGKPIDPADDSEGARDRPPTLQTPATVPETEPATGGADQSESQVNSPLENGPGSILALGLSAPTALALLAAQRGQQTRTRPTKNTAKTE